MPETNKNIVGSERWPLLFWLLLIASVVVLLSGCAAQSSRPAENQSTASGGEQASRGGLGHPVLGDPGAPVLMVEYGDFQ